VDLPWQSPLLGGVDLIISNDSDKQKVEFLLSIQRLLNEGSFVATYKYALLIALADLSIECSDTGESQEIGTRQIAEKFIEYYWRQTIPFISTEKGEKGILKQNTGRQAAILNLIVKARVEANGSLARAKQKTKTWWRLVEKVEAIIKTMPLWKLQTIGRGEVPFLYKNTKSGNAIELLPNVAHHFRIFHELILNLIQGAWVRHVRRIQDNQKLFGEIVDLREFLFGSERENLGEYRPILKEIQSGLCFYCRKLIHGPGDIDHFIPWTRYPIDLGHNFVLAHTECNRHKRDYLAAEDHLGHWLRRNAEWPDQLRNFFEEKGILNNLTTSAQITKWAYETAELSRAHVWVKNNEVRPISSNWRNLFSGSL
jgi:5-methylcytosine-specific restriction endonuclease McrA